MDDLVNLSEDRFLQKAPSQSEQTKGAVYTASNPAPIAGYNASNKIGQTNGSTEDNGAPNIQTGTVIVACIIQTSALPSRVELQGNDVTLFDDTYEQNGKVLGDTARIVFTHGSAKNGEVITAGFIFEKRASVFNTYDNVLSFYSPKSPDGDYNYVFFGRNATEADTKANINSIHFAVNAQSDFVNPTPGVFNPLNGVFDFEYFEDGVLKAYILLMGNSESLSLPVTGYSAVLQAGDGGIVGLGYVGTGVLLYLLDGTTVTLGANFIPDTDAAYDIGTSSKRIKNVYVSGSIIGATISLPGGITWTSGTGSPETHVTAPIGSLYSNVSGGATTTLYVKTSGTGNTGWTAK